MIGMAIQVLWLLIGLVILCAVIWLALYVIETVVGIAIPDRVKQGIWLVVLLLIIIFFSFLAILLSISPVALSFGNPKNLITDFLKRICKVVDFNWFF